MAPRCRTARMPSNSSPCTPPSNVGPVAEPASSRITTWPRRGRFHRRAVRGAPQFAHLNGDPLADVEWPTRGHGRSGAELASTSRTWARMPSSTWTNGYAVVACAMTPCSTSAAFNEPTTDALKLPPANGCW